MNDQEAINIEKLEVGYSKALNSPANLKAYPGDFICVLGKNGCGKSTLLKTIAGILKPIAGEIYLFNQKSDKIDVKQKAKIVSFVPSRLAYLANIKVIDLVSLGRTPYTNILNKLSNQDNEVIHQAVEEFGLKELQHKPLFQISDGEKQKAMICRAYVQNTPIILLDEPSAFLDYPSKVELIERLNYLSNNKNKTIIFSSHDLELSLNKTNKLWIFDNNRISQKHINDKDCNKILKDIFNFDKKK